MWNKVNRRKTSEITLSILGISLITPTVTRWNSLYDATLRILSKKEMLQDLCNALSVPRFSQIYLEYLEEYSTIMEPLAATLDFLQRENNLYYGYLIPSLVILKTKLKNLASSDGLKILKEVVPLLEANLLKRFKPFFDNEVNDAVVASVLCTSIKTRWYTILSKIGTIRTLEDIKSTVLRYAIAVAKTEDNTSEETKNESANETVAFFDFGEDGMS